MAELTGSVGTPLMWGLFLTFVLLMLALDLGVFHRKAHRISMREAATWSGVWVGLALLFAAGIHAAFGPTLAMEFLSGYVIEKALSVDNIFVFVVIFGFFAVPATQQHRVLELGILGALVLRAVFILAGAAFISRFHWAVYLFGGFLVFTGYRLLRAGDEQPDLEKNVLLRAVRRFLPVAPGAAPGNFLVSVGGKWHATPLLLALVTVEATDVVFAVDSIPAIFAVTRDPFIVFTSNIFAILGLRSLYFLLAGVIERFHLLKIGLALVLMFVGGKMLAADLVVVPTGVSLLIICALIGGAAVASLVFPRAAAVPPNLTAERGGGSA